ALPCDRRENREVIAGRRRLATSSLRWKSPSTGTRLFRKLGGLLGGRGGVFDAPGRGAPRGVEDSAPATQQALPNQGHVLGNGDTLLACAVLPVRALLVDLPQSDRHVLAARGQHPAVGRQSDRVDTALVPFQALKQLAAAGVPEPGRLVS